MAASASTPKNVWTPLLESALLANERTQCMGEFVKAASTSEIAPGQARLVNIKGKEIALFNIEGNFFALGNACTHEEGPLAEGDIEGHEVTCPWHGARFDIRTGEVLCAPAYDDVARYNVRVIGTEIEVEV
jgi:nitrite reductase/ring-hydroxylating ferredoxin subunit